MYWVKKLVKEEDNYFLLINYFSFDDAQNLVIKEAKCVDEDDFIRFYNINKKL